MSAKQKQGMAALEEFLQQKYVEIYNDVEENDNINKVEELMNINKYSVFFYIPSNEGIGGLRYVVDSEGHALYLIKKANLPEEIKEGLVGGDAGEGTYNDYVGLNDVYGVTTNLKVYYCSGGLDTLQGLARENLDNDNPRREVFSKDAPMSKLLSKYDIDKDGVISAEETKSVKNLELDNDSRNNSFK